DIIVVLLCNTAVMAAQIFRFTVKYADNHIVVRDFSDGWYAIDCVPI
ncbi:hypothetical protein NEILACOT_05766, partial [Neisseria lactamica ATCC 23970]